MHYFGHPCNDIFFVQIVAIEILIHLHNDDSVAATDALNTAFGYCKKNFFLCLKLMLFL